MAITRPMLPPKAGYVEVEVDGVRTYRNVETGILIGEEVHAPSVDERVKVLEEQYAAIEDALCEMDASNAASIAAIEDALCEMDKEG